MLIEKNLNYEGHFIYYRVSGNGIPVVFIHGFGEDGEIWNKQVQFLQDRFALIVPDLPGSGRSEMIEDMSIDALAEVIRNIIDAELPEAPEAGSYASRRNNPVVIGHSMGGYVALAFADKYSENLKGFGLFHSTAYPDTEEKKATRRKGIQFIKEHGAFEFLKTANYNLFSQLSKDKMPKLIGEFIDSLRNFSAEALVSYYEAMINRPDRTATLRKLQIPMLFIAGKHDTAIPLNDVLEQCHLPEISYFHILAESGHLGMIEETEKSNKILNDYLINLS